MSTPATDAVTVVVADDQTVVREGLRAMLDMLPGLSVVAVAATAEEALDLVGVHDPDVLLTDLRMPGIGGVEGIRRLRTAGSRTAAVALTTYDDDASVLDAVDAGALGFLNKDADPETIAAAIRSAATGRSLLDQRALSAVVGRAGTFPHTPGDDRQPAGAVTAPPDGLTAREVDVLRLVAAGRSNQQIAHELFVSLATVKTHINHLFTKTGCQNRADLVRYAHEHRLAH